MQRKHDSKQGKRERRERRDIERERQRERDRERDYRSEISVRVHSALKKTERSTVCLHFLTAVF